MAWLGAIFLWGEDSEVWMMISFGTLLQFVWGT